MPKNTNKKKKTGTNFNLTTESLIVKYQIISVNFKIRISQLISKILLRQRILNQVRHFLTGHIEFSHHFFYQKN